MKVEELPGLIGRTLAPSPWITVDQSRINAFAECTEDRQFIHTEPERAARESPFGTAIAHGFLTLSLIPASQPEDFPRPDDLGVTVNYGLDRVRFMSPVPAGARVRLHTKILDAQVKGPGRVLVKAQKQMEIEGGPKPAYIAEQLTLFVARGA
ncbi:MAG: hypothetical protein RLZZ200_51 [Pseudomonadota bacterium]|jgi:acyl dehydratase